jgi:penicillin-binding protein 2
METDARMTAVSRGILEPPVAGKNVTLSIDSRLQSALYEFIYKLAHDVPFQGGAGVIMDVKTGDVVVLTSVPEYSGNVMMSGDTAAIAAYSTDTSTPYLARAIAGLYAPGSIVKPYFAAAALNEKLVRPETTFISTGSIYVANPYHPGEGSRFRDWRAHGAVDMRRALAVSSDVYFYYIGGGFGSQEGLGITRLNKYARLFGFGAPTGIELEGEAAGVVPSPEWKAETFGDDQPWRVGDTYHTVIGQYGFQVTAVQAVRAVASIANGGHLRTPRIAPSVTPFSSEDVGIPDRYLAIVRAGMHDGVHEGGTAAGLNVPYVDVAAKTGTAEIGVGKNFVNSWVTGFFPYDNPRYAFAVVMEHGPTHNLYGATYVMRQMLDWLHANHPEFLEAAPINGEQDDVDI